MSDGKNSLHKIANYWNKTFNRQRFHFSGQDIYVHGSNALGENKSEKNETSKQIKLKHKSRHRVYLFIVKIKIKYLNNFTITNLVQYK